MKKILIPLPAYGFDPTEAAIPWKHLTENKYLVQFATPAGAKAGADRRMIAGNGLGIFKKLLMARLDATAAYAEMIKSDSFDNPLKYDDLREQDFDALLLPGGHDHGVREYLESETLQQLLASFFKAKKPVGAICHGVVLAARSIDVSTGKSVLYDYRTTSLLRSQELGAYWLTRWWLKNYYRTYPGCTVQQEVITALKDKSQFLHGPSSLKRDDYAHLKRGFAVRDRHYLSARWPGDVYNFSIEFLKMLEGK